MTTKVICDYDSEPHPLNDDDRPCKNPTQRYAQWQTCPNVPSHTAEWYPLNDASDPRWYARCRRCNVEGYLVPEWDNAAEAPSSDEPTVADLLDALEKSMEAAKAAKAGR